MKPFSTPVHSNERHLVLRPITLAVGVVLVLAGCNLVDPYKKAGVWRPSMVNDTNLELQIARSSDLTMGRGTTGADGETAAAPVDRLRKDKVKALPLSGIAPIGASAGGGSN